VCVCVCVCVCYTLSHTIRMHTHTCMHARTHTHARARAHTHTPVQRHTIATRSSPGRLTDQLQSSPLSPGCLCVCVLNSMNFSALLQGHVSRPRTGHALSSHLKVSICKNEMQDFSVPYFEATGHAAPMNHATHMHWPCGTHYPTLQDITVRPRHESCHACE